MVRIFSIAMLLLTFSPSILAANCKPPGDNTESLLSYNSCKRSLIFDGAVCSNLLARIEDSLNEAMMAEQKSEISQRLCRKSYDDGQPSKVLCDDAIEKRQIHEQRIRYTADIATIYKAGCR